MQSEPKSLELETVQGKSKGLEKLLPFVPAIAATVEVDFVCALMNGTSASLAMIAWCMARAGSVRSKE